MRPFVMADGVELALHELADRALAPELPSGESAPHGTAALVLFAHAAGLCATVLRPLARELSTLFSESVGYDARAHGASSRGTADALNWSQFGIDASAVACSFSDRGRPLVGVGHSFGASALLLAEARQPGTFDRLYLYEPIVTLDAVKHRHGDALAAATARRRDRFASREEAASRFAGRPPFSAFPEEVLAAYVNDALTENDRGELQLSCRPSDEAAIYRLGPCLVTPELAAAVRCPVFLAYGTTSRDPGRDASAPLLHALATSQRDGLTGLGHFGPLEDPAAVAAWIIHQY